MLIFFGTRRIRIRTFTDVSTPCPICEEYHKQCSIYQPCFHIFWIPVFPIGRKYIITTCSKCNSQYKIVQHPELSATRTPIYMFSVLILFAVIIAFSFFSAHRSSKKTAEYIQNPAVGDIYLMRDTIDGDRYYYFSKIFLIENDSVFMQTSAYNYSKYTSSMDKKDYYVEEYLYPVHKDDLKKWHDKKMIRKIERTEEP